MLIVSKRLSTLFHQFKEHFLFLVDHVPATLPILVIHNGVRVGTSKITQEKCNRSCAQKEYKVVSLPQLNCSLLSVSFSLLANINILH